jgi:hypothetical protein
VGAFQQVEDLPGQRPGVEQHGGSMPGQRAEHQVAHIVAGRLARAQAGCQQVSTSAMVAADAADLQVAAVGGLDHAAGEALGGRHRFGLVGQQQAARQLDPADAAIAGTTMRHNPGQAEGRGEMLGAWACVKGYPAICEGALECRRRGIMPALSGGMKSRWSSIMQF